MALQDLTPQLRTRLSRMERAVGWFAGPAVVLRTAGFVYPVYSTPESKVRFKTKASFRKTDALPGNPPKPQQKPQPG